jgi:hypothetical protein
MALDLNATMDALGVRLATIAGLRVFDFPPDALTVPAAVVAFPELDFDQTYQAGADRATFPVHILTGKVSERASRDEIGKFAARAGASSVKTTLEADPTLAGAVDSLRVRRATFSTMTVGGAEYLAATFDVEVYA